jgi:acyl-CoA thioesterase-1
MTLGLACACASPGEERHDAEPLRVLLLGDSISMGYTPFVQETLADRAVVIRPTHENGRAENCAGTNNGIVQLDRWLALDGGGWDVIHFNFGLHDLKRVEPETGKNSDDPSDPHQADLASYEAQLQQIVMRLQSTGARLVFATTTPVPDGELRPHREPGDAIAYNRVAEAVMQDAGVPVNDLHRFIAESDPPLSQYGDVHFTAEGSRALGERVAEAILDAALTGRS